MEWRKSQAKGKKIAKSSKKCRVFALDTDAAKFFPFDGNRVRYDENSIPEEQIWRIHPDQKQYGVILIAEDRRKHSRAAV